MVESPRSTRCLPVRHCRAAAASNSFMRHSNAAGTRPVTSGRSGRRAPWHTSGTQRRVRASHWTTSLSALPAKHGPLRTIGACKLLSLRNAPPVVATAITQAMTMAACRCEAVVIKQTLLCGCSIRGRPRWADATAWSAWISAFDQLGWMLDCEWQRTNSTADCRWMYLGFQQPIRTISNLGFSVYFETLVPVPLLGNSMQALLRGLRGEEFVPMLGNFTHTVSRMDTGRQTQRQNQLQSHPTRALKVYVKPTSS